MQGHAPRYSTKVMKWDAYLSDFSDDVRESLTSYQLAVIRH